MSVEKENGLTMNTSVQEDSNTVNEMKAHIGKNLITLLKLLKKTQKAFAQEIGIAPSMLNEYIKGKAVPSLFVIHRICNNPSINRFGFTIQDFICTDIDFMYSSLINTFNQCVIHESKECIKKINGLGVYMVCFANNAHAIDDSKPLLKYGVLFIYRISNNTPNSNPYKALLRIFPAYEAAKELFTDLNMKHKLYENELNGDWKAICEVCEVSVEDGETHLENNDSYYIGDVFFSKAQKPHMFFNLGNVGLGDYATFIFNMPPKRSSSEYIGGLGVVTSICRGLEHLPVAHKVIISKYLFDADENGSCDEAARESIFKKHLVFTNKKLNLGEKADDLASFCMQLMADKSGLLKEDDKRALLKNRIGNIVLDCFEANARCIFGVPDTDDNSVYQELKSFMKYNSQKQTDNRMISD